MFTNITIMPLFPNEVFLQWSLENSSEPSSYDFYLYKNRTGINAEWEQINTVPIRNTYSVTIPEVILSKDEDLYFKIELQLNNKRYKSNIVGFGADLNKRDFYLAKEIARKVQLVRNKLNGIQCKIYKRKNYGEPCDKCIDIATKKVTHSHCETCYGTRIKTGYYQPISIYCKIHEVTPKEQKESPMGTIDNVVATAEIHYPILARGDIIVEQISNKRWFVNTSKKLFYKSVVFDQNVELRMLSAKDIEYNVN